MARYIGQNSPYGVFEKQVLTLTGLTAEYQLFYQVGSPNGILVIYNDILQESGVDYSLTNGGSNILFAFVPLVTDRIYLIYLGRELAIPAVSGQQPYRATATGDGATTDFTMPIGPISEQALQIFADGILQRFNEDWILDITGQIVQFVIAPGVGVDLDFYIHGVERTDTFTVPDGSITGVKLQVGINIGTNIQPAGNIFATNLTLDGDLVVNGTTTTINTTNLDVTNNEIILNSDFISGAPIEDASIIVRRGSSPDTQLFWNESTDAWYAGITGSIEKIILNTEFTNHTTNFSNPHGVTKTQIGLSNVTNDAQLKRSANDFSSFTVKSQSDNSDIFIIEDSAASGIKKYVNASDILPPTVNHDITFTGNITFDGTTRIGNLLNNDVQNFETTDDITTTAYTLILDDNVSSHFKIRVISKNTNPSINKHYWASIEGGVRRHNGSGATLIGTTPTVDDDEGSSGYTAEVNVSGNNLIVEVTGGLGETVHWSIHVEYFGAS